MSNIDQFIERYVQAWNEPDANTRRQRIRELWSDDASLFNRAADYHGHAGIEQAVTNSYERFVARGFRFRARHDTTSHHDAVRFTWEMATSADGDVDSIGTQFLILASDGRILLDYQFIETPPSQ